MPSTLTITEALAEIKTLGKRMEKKRGTVGQYIARNDRIRDPFEKDGGSAKVLAAEMQSLIDLETRLVRIRLAIQAANHRIEITLGGMTRTIAGWLTWRKEVAPQRQAFLAGRTNALVRMRKDVQQKGMTVGASASVTVGPDTTENITIAVDEFALMQESETLTTVLGDLDGQLSLKNATELITIED